ncbi:hypothetical protein BJ138DRAFT_135520 [Hygrophoropsis aurantiaca]|uniref:Uncharacterized protein n=1 Tax=Hygrophoropsis aurantiaca TaxID=72124 RepID=A0ACB7ZRM9_9AGAM|nr:hypothetical protein BJ138DRAFT_135520 [Hygrophoropsis aurantiaca]
MAASPLPSFIELMASLGINDNANTKPSSSSESRYTPSLPAGSRSRSGSASSISSSFSCSSLSPSIRPIHLSADSSPSSIHREIGELDGGAGAGRRQRHRAVRYSPYISASSSSRLHSVPSLIFSQADDDVDSSRSSVSPGPPSPRRPPSLNFSRERPASTPISSYVRRKTPQNSPTAAMFPHRIHRDVDPEQRMHRDIERTISPPMLIPMTLPTLPPMLVTSN